MAVPAFDTIPPFGMVMSIGSVEGLEFELARILHGDQTLTIHSPIPTSGTVRQKGSVVGIYDKGRGALIVIEVVSTLEKTGEPLFTNRSARSTGHVFPGETLMTRIWEEDDRYVVEARVRERGTRVLGNAAVTVG